jgi:hypothetical protein
MTIKLTYNADACRWNQWAERSRSVFIVAYSRSFGTFKLLCRTNNALIRKQAMNHWHSLSTVEGSFRLDKLRHYNWNKITILFKKKQRVANQHEYCIKIWHKMRRFSGCKLMDDVWPKTKRCVLQISWTSFQELCSFDVLKLLHCR